MIVESTPSRSATRVFLRQRQPHGAQARQCEPRDMIAGLYATVFRSGAASIAIVTVTVLT